MPSYVVTGAARGIGLEFVRQISSSSENTVFALVRSKKTANHLEELARKNVHILEADVTDAKALKAAAQDVKAVTGGKLDVLINNAAYLGGAEFRSFSIDAYPEGREDALDDDFEKCFAVNVTGVIHAINAFLPLIREGTLKRIITLSTAACDPQFVRDSGITFFGAYVISKAATNTTMAKYATDARHKKDGLIFLSIHPGLVNTIPTSNEVPTPENMQMIMSLISAIGKLYPSFKGPISPEDSVKAVLREIGKATVADSGSFVSAFGGNQWF